MEYQSLKHLHISFAIISGALFLLRAYWCWFRPQRLQARWVKIVPHVVDTGLLASAITLVVWAQLAPLQQPWLMAKIIALVAYIVAGSIALKYGKTPGQRATALLVAVACFVYILKLAVTRQIGW